MCCVALVVPGALGRAIIVSVARLLGVTDGKWREVATQEDGDDVMYVYMTLEL